MLRWMPGTGCSWKASSLSMWQVVSYYRRIELRIRSILSRFLSTLFKLISIKNSPFITVQGNWLEGHSMNLRKYLESIVISTVLVAIPFGSQLAVADEVAKKAPRPMDVNGDGKADAWDSNGDGIADVWDTNADGKPDAWDSNGDGKPNLFDTNGDGKPDSAKQGGDGKAE
ncbi:MAG: hypothetical protein P8J20_12180 [Novosphingobium sp.]|nr:hypothetical protein [Novosphingobium sp.]